MIGDGPLSKPPRQSLPATCAVAVPPVLYCPARPLPPYTYVPGQTPHPLSDPAGHSFGHVEPSVSTAEAADWRRSSTFLHGIDLFNAGCYWEAHEAWERCWIAAGRTGAVADALKGLIKLAAAGVKQREGNPAGVARHLARARQLFDAAGPAASRLGLDAAILAAGFSSLPGAIPFRPATA